MRSIKETVNKFFIAVDEHDWETVEALFTEEVETDYSSMNGQPASVVKAKDLIDSWKGFLPGFEHTHHQLGNMIVKEEEQAASVFSYVTATHFLENEGGNIWTVVGTYDIDLVKNENEYRLSKIRLNFKYQDGNANLASVAMEKMEK